MECHFSVLYGQCTLSVTCLVCMEHTAVGIELCTVYTILQLLCFRFGFRLCLGGNLGRCLSRPFRLRCKCTCGHQHHRSTHYSQKAHYGFLFHNKISFHTATARRPVRTPGGCYSFSVILAHITRNYNCKSYAFLCQTVHHFPRESIAACVCATYSCSTASILPRPSIWESTLSNAPDSTN